MIKYNKCFNLILLEPVSFTTQRVYLKNFAEYEATVIYIYMCVCVCACVYMCVFTHMHTQICLYI